MNRFLLLVVAFAFSVSSFSQVGPEVASLNFGDSIIIDGISVEFIELISDSRCPKNVNCIRAGEAEVMVAIYKNGEFSHKKKLVFHASGVVNQGQMQLVNSEDLVIQGLALFPYPKGLGKIIDQQYSLDIQIN